MYLNEIIKYYMFSLYFIENTNCIIILKFLLINIKFSFNYSIKIKVWLIMDKETKDILRLIRSQNIGPKNFYNLIKFLLIKEIRNIL